jgi:hypothetical protein
MRLYKRNGVYQVDINGRRKSLGTKDEREATAIYREMKKEYLRGRIFDLEKVKRLPLSDFALIYLPYRQDNVSPKTLKKDALSLKLLAEAFISCHSNTKP